MRLNVCNKLQDEVFLIANFLRGHCCFCHLIGWPLLCSIKCYIPEIFIFVSIINIIIQKTAVFFTFYYDQFLTAGANPFSSILSLNNLTPHTELTNELQLYFNYCQTPGSTSDISICIHLHANMVLTVKIFLSLRGPRAGSFRPLPYNHIGFSWKCMVTELTTGWYSDTMKSLL